MNVDDYFSKTIFFFILFIYLFSFRNLNSVQLIRFYSNIIFQWILFIDRDYRSVVVL